MSEAPEEINPMFVGALVPPRKTAAETLSEPGRRMREVEMSKQQAAAERMRALRTQRNAQLNNLLKLGNNTENFSKADLQALGSAKRQAYDLFASNPDSYPELYMELANIYNAGKTHASLKDGVNNPEATYIGYMDNTKEFRGPDGMMPIVNLEDYGVRGTSFDDMGVQTGGVFQSDSGFKFPIYDYYEPGSTTLMKDQFKARHADKEVQTVENPDGTVTIQAMQDGVVLDKQMVSGPIQYYPARGNARFYNPQTINIERTPPEVLLDGSGPGISHIVTGLRGKVQSKEFKESEAELALIETVSRIFNSASGTGMRASALDMWNQTYGEQYGEYSDETAETYQLPTPLKMYTDEIVKLANVSYKAPAPSSRSTRQSQFAGDSKAYSVKTGLPDTFVQDQQDEKRGVLYQNMDEELQRYGTNTQELLEGKRVHIHVPGQKLLYNDRRYENLEVYLDQNIIMLEKADNYEGKASSRLAANRWSPERLNDRYWSSLPEKRYDIIQIYEADNKTLTDPMNDLLGDFAKAYGSDPQVNNETLMQIIAEKFSQQ